MSVDGLIAELLELCEDLVLSELMDKRLMETTKWISHEEAWSEPSHNA
jgi:hypothetical protein